MVMNAVEFIKLHGWKEVKILLTSPSHGFFFKEDFFKHYGYDIYDDLKQYIGAYDLVQSYGGLEKSKKLIEYWEFASVFGTDEKLEPAVNLMEKIK